MAAMSRRVFSLAKNRFDAVTRDTIKCKESAEADASGRTNAMIFGLFKSRDGNADIVDRLHQAVVEAARRPVFYTDLGVPDTVEGRFDLVTLHATLVVRRLRALPEPASSLAQDLVDAIFLNFDRALRELGVGDISVPKRMKTMASAFLGRARAYEAALPADDAELAKVLARNVLNRTDVVPAEAERLAAYVRRCVTAFDATGFDAFEAGRPPFPDPLVPEEARS